MTDLGRLQDADWMKARHLDDGLSQSEIGRLVDAPPEMVDYWLLIHGVPRRPYRREPRVTYPVSADLLDDADWMREMYLNRRLSPSRIGTLAGVRDAAVVQRKLLAYGIPLRKQRGRVIDRQWLRRKYLEERLTIDAIADQAGAPKKVISEALRRDGIKTRRSSHPPLMDREWVRARYEDEGLSDARIATLVGCSPAAAHRARRRHGVPTRARPPAPSRPPVRQGTPGPQVRFPELRDREWLTRKYIDEGLTGQQIADQLGCSRAAVSLARIRLGIPKRQTPPDEVAHRETLQRERRREREARRRQVAPLKDARWLRARYVDEHMSVRAIADLLGCGDGTVAAAIVRHDLPPQPRSRRPTFMQANDPQWLRERVVTDGMSPRAIAALIGCSVSLVRLRLRDHPDIQASLRK